MILLTIMILKIIVIVIEIKMIVFYFCCDLAETYFCLMIQIMRRVEIVWIVILLTIMIMIPTHLLPKVGQGTWLPPSMMVFLTGYVNMNSWI